MPSYKVMLLGEIGVGKSSLARRLAFDQFEGDYKPTLGVDVYRYEVPKSADTETPASTLIIWDTDGNLGDNIFQHVYMREAAAALIVGDVTRSGTLETMISLSDEFRRSFPGRYCAFITNKIDMLTDPGDPKTPPELRETRIPIFPTSAKTGSNVKFAFHEAAAAIHRRKH